MCTRPLIRSSRDAYGRGILQHFPCGKCPECLCDRQNSWKLRLIEEASNWSCMYFFTLTYSDDSLPLTDDGRSQVLKSDIQNWLKRFRTRYERSFGDKPEFRYFIASEYAPEGFYCDRNGKMRQSTMRPHYHGVIFTNISRNDIVSYLFSDWSKNYGFYKLDLIQSHRENYSSVANYVSKYCCKGCFASRQDEIKQGLINNTFNLMSKGIGISYVDKHCDFHLNGCNPCNFTTPESLDKIVASRFVQDGPFKYKMPRYWSDRIYKITYTTYRPFYDKDLCKILYRKVKRFSSKTPISLQITSALQERFKERLLVSLKGFELFKKAAVNSSSDFFGTDTASISLRENRKRSKLEAFYRSCALRNSSLCFSNF